MVYVLVCDWDWGDGAQCDFLGVYKSKESAQKAMEKGMKDDINNLCDGDLTDMELDKDSYCMCLREIADYRYVNYNIYETELKD